MNNVLYVFNEALAERLSSAGYKLHNQGKGENGVEYFVFLKTENDDTSFLLNFAAGKDYVFTNKIFF